MYNAVSEYVLSVFDVLGRGWRWAEGETKEEGEEAVGEER